MDFWLIAVVILIVSIVCLVINEMMKPRWKFIADLKIGDGGEVKVGEKFECGWKFKLFGPAGKYLISPINIEDYSLKEGIIKGQIISVESIEFHKEKSKPQVIDVLSTFIIKDPGHHSTSFVMCDPKYRKVKGFGFLYKDLIAK